jgi:hypothetical protein
LTSELSSIMSIRTVYVYIIYIYTYIYISIHICLPIYFSLSFYTCTDAAKVDFQWAVKGWNRCNGRDMPPLGLSADEGKWGCYCELIPAQVRA